MRSAVLWRTVDRILPQLAAGDELIVVDQNEPPLAAPAGPGDARLRLLRLGPPSLTRARNLGIASAANPLIVFLDDDIVPDPDLLAALRGAAAGHPGCIIAGLVDQDDKPEGVASPGTVDLRSGRIETHFARPVSGELPFFPGGLALIPRSALPPQPCFNPDFRGASQGEEIDFSLRVRERGVRIVAAPEARIFHLKVVEGGCRAPEFRQRFWLDHVFNQGLFYGRHGKLLHAGAFLARVKGFVGFHARRPGGGHDAGRVLKAAWLLAEGFAKGLLARL
jgi:GT2 family glycosyltransferase